MTHSDRLAKMTGIYASHRGHEQCGLIRSGQPLKVLASGYARMGYIILLESNIDGVDICQESRKKKNL